MNPVRLLFTLLLLMMASVNAYCGNRVALVIGNSHYQQLGKLDNPVGDATAIAETLQAKGYTLIDKNGKDTQDAQLDLTGNEIITAITQFGERAASAEIAFVYYAGHGMQSGARPLLLPVDVPIQSLELVQRNAIDLERDILTPLDGKAALTVAVFDACRDIPALGEIMRNVKSRGSQDIDYRGLARIGDQGKSRIVAYAGAAGQVVGDDAGGGHSPYTQTLLAELNKNNWEMGNLFRQVASTFKKQYGGQSPEVLMQGDVPPDKFFLEVGHAKVAVQDQQALEKAKAKADALYWQQQTEAKVQPQAKQGLITTEPVEPVTAGSTIKDCHNCPELVTIPSGEFVMGSPESERDRDLHEGPHHTVHISYGLAVGKYEVSFAEWDACVAAGGCAYKPDDEGWGRGNRPVIKVSWNHIKQQYLPWLNRKAGLSARPTNQQYRLLTEAEWEYVARAGTSTVFSFGEQISTDMANYDGNASNYSPKGRNRYRTVSVNSFAPNAWGVYNMHGNVWEWVEDCYQKSYFEAPNDGRAVQQSECSLRVLRGGSWGAGSRFLRSAYRDAESPNNPTNDYIGFRLARTL